MAPAAEWHCPHCNEPVPADFDVCWNCGTGRDGMTDPGFEPVVAFTPQCAWCGYLLYGLTSLICPECGAPFDPNQRDTPRAIRDAT